MVAIASRVTLSGRVLLQHRKQLLLLRSAATARGARTFATRTTSAGASSWLRDDTARLPRRERQPAAGTASFHSTRVACEPSKRDFYDVLGVSRDADKNEIKKKYYQLAKKYHPDTNKADPNTAKKFAEATEAWEILGDDDKRQKYDAYGHAGVDEQSGFGGGGGGFQGQGFEDIF
ncbi:hypothetical protein BBJ28_00023015, partial [Nothophytophthora sp. Chile5]